VALSSTRVISAKLLGSLTTGLARHGAKASPVFPSVLGKMSALLRHNAASHGSKGALDHLKSALQGLGLPLAALQLPAPCREQLLGLLQAQGIEPEKAAELLRRCSTENGAVALDRLFLLLRGHSEPHPEKKPLSVPPEQRVALEALLNTMGMPPEQIRLLVEGAAGSAAGLDVDKLVSGLHRLGLQVNRADFIRFCRANGINPVPPRLQAAPAGVSSPGSGPNHLRQLELAAQLRQQDVKPEQIKRLLERLSSNPKANRAQLNHPEPGPQRNPASRAPSHEKQAELLFTKVEPRPSSRGGTAPPHRRLDLGPPLPPPANQAAARKSANVWRPAPESRTRTEPASFPQGGKAKGVPVMPPEHLGLQAHSGRQSKRGRTQHGLGPSSFNPVSGPGLTSRAAATSGQAAAPAFGGDAAISPQLQVAQRLIAMSTNGTHRARLRLHPPELGHIRIDLTLEHNRVSAALMTETQAAKELLQAHMGQLRQHLAQHGLQLEDFQLSVSQDASSFRQDSEGTFFGGNRRTRGPEEAADLSVATVEAEMQLPPPVATLGSNRRIDLFA